MKIAIHHYPGSFSDRWISYCKKNNIAFKLVNAYDNDIIDQLSDCDVFMWNHLHYKYKDVLLAKQLLYSVEISGKKIFPDFNTTWHYDNKLGQKYLFESINAPFVPTYIFYSKQEALEWANQTIYPKVFKFSRGAGSENVRLVKKKKNANKLIKKAFGNGFSQYNGWNVFRERYRIFQQNNKSLFWLFKGIIYFFLKSEFSKMHSREKGYIYFQDFIPNNSFDIRVIIIGSRAFAIKRMTRKKDFRASGSGRIIYEYDEIDERCIKISFQVNKTLKSQCIAYDFVFDQENNPLIVEISYGFSVKGYDQCPGYWDSNIKWCEGSFNPQEWMIENLIRYQN